MVALGAPGFFLLMNRIKEHGLTRVPDGAAAAAGSSNGAAPLPGKVAFPSDICDEKYNLCDERMNVHGLQAQYEFRVEDPQAIKPHGLLLGFMDRNKLNNFFDDPAELELKGSAAAA